MATKSATINVDVRLAEAYNAAPKTKQKKALSAMRQALRVAPASKSKDPRLSKEETALFLTINRALPEDKQKRYDELTEKRLDETLTESEHAELGELVQEVEQIWVERLQAVIELARLRKVSPAKMMKQLELDPRVKVS